MTRADARAAARGSRPTGRSAVTDTVEARRAPPARPRRSAAAAAWSRRPCRPCSSPCCWLTTRDLDLALARQRRRGAGAARGPAGAALDGAVRRQRAGRHRHRLVVRAPRREPRRQRRRPGAGLLPARHALQRRVRRGAGVHLPDRLAAGRLHGRQRHRRPDGLAPRPAGRAAVHPADLAAGAAVRAAGGRPGRRSGWPATPAASSADTAVAALGVLKIVHGLAAPAGRARLRWSGCSARNHTPLEPDARRPSAGASVGSARGAGRG